MWRNGTVTRCNDTVTVLQRFVTVCNGAHRGEIVVERLEELLHLGLEAAAARRPPHLLEAGRRRRDHLESRVRGEAAEGCGGEGGAKGGMGR